MTDVTLNESSLTSSPVLSLVSTAYATIIGAIQSSDFLSTYNGKTLTDITGLVTANVWPRAHFSPLPGLIPSKGPSAFWLADANADSESISTGVVVYSTSTAVLSSVEVGDLVSLAAKVAEYRSASRPNDLHLTELISPTKKTVLSSGNSITPMCLDETKARRPSSYHL